MDDRAGCYDRMVADRDAGKDRRISADHNMGANDNVAKPILLDQIFMGENRCIISNNRIIADRNAFWKEDIDHNH